jgi:protein-tyrosine-phosphatase
MAHILVVCTANICRSPVAMALLRDRLARRGLEDWTVDSAGTWAVARRGAAQYSRAVMAQAGLDIDDHIARMVTEPLLDGADLVLCMEEGHVEALRNEFPAQAYKIHPITEMAGPVYSIADPYGGQFVDYQRMAAEMASVIDRGLLRIIALASENSREP